MEEPANQNVTFSDAQKLETKNGLRERLQQRTALRERLKQTFDNRYKAGSGPNVRAALRIANAGREQIFVFKRNFGFYDAAS